MRDSETWYAAVHGVAKSLGKCSAVGFYKGGWEAERKRRGLSMALTQSLVLAVHGDTGLAAVWN